VVQYPQLDAQQSFQDFDPREDGGRAAADIAIRVEQDQMAAGADGLIDIVQGHDHSLIMIPHFALQQFQNRYLVP